MSTRLRNRIIELTVLTALLLPLFCLNLNGTHDWGGDFARYIEQSMNLRSGESNYLFNPECPELGPPSYPVGLPLLLSPISALWGNNMMAFQIFMTILLLVLGCLTFTFLRRQFTWAESGVAVLLFLYNPVVIGLKDEVLSDIPFTIFILAALTAYLNIRERPGNPRASLQLLGVAAFLGFAILHRNIGLVFLLAMLIDLGRKHLRLSAALFGGTLGLYALFDQVLFPAEIELNQHFLKLFLSNGFRETITTTHKYYVTLFLKFFVPEGVGFNFLSLAIGGFAITFFMLGLVWKLLDRPTVIEWSVLGYLAVIFLYPITTQGFRFLLPIFPLMLSHIITGLRALRMPRPMSPRWVAIFVLIAVGLPYQNDLRQALRADENHLGPQSAAAQELFTFVRENTKEEAVFVFAKPRVLGLYGERKAFAQHHEKTLLSSDFDYLILAEELSDPAGERYLKNHGSQLQSVFENARFVIYASKGSTLR